MLKIKFNILKYVASEFYFKNNFDRNNFVNIFFGVIFPIFYALIPFLFNLLYIQSWNDSVDTDDMITSFHVFTAFMWCGGLWLFPFLRTVLAKVMWCYAIFSFCLVWFSIFSGFNLADFIGLNGKNNSYLIWYISFILGVIVVSFSEKNKC